MPPQRAQRTVFVTVGTTKFDALIRAVDRQPFADALVAAGYTRLVMQIGRWAGGAAGHGAWRAGPACACNDLGVPGLPMGHALV